MGKFTQCLDQFGTRLHSLYERSGQFYASIRPTGGSSRLRLLLNEAGKPVTTLDAALQAQKRLVAAKHAGVLIKGRLPGFKDYVRRYLRHLSATGAKSPLTILNESSVLNIMSIALRNRPLDKITVALVNGYVEDRAKDISTGRVNTELNVLNNVLKFAKAEGYLTGELITKRVQKLKYVAPKRQLLSQAEIDRLCAESISGKHPSGQFLSDFIKFCAYSGARAQAALSAKWDQVDWANKQLKLYTKFDKTVVVDFNPMLEKHLQEMDQRNMDAADWIFPNKKTGNHESYPQESVKKVAVNAGVPGFKLHDSGTTSARPV